MRRSVSDRPSGSRGTPGRAGRRPRRGSAAPATGWPRSCPARRGRRPGAPPRRRRPARGRRWSAAWPPPAGRGAGRARARRARRSGRCPGLADADQGDPAGRHPERVRGRQDLGDLQLVVQVGLEPEHVRRHGWRPAPVRSSNRRDTSTASTPSAAAMNSARTRRNPASSSPPGTAPSCSTSAQATACRASPARRSRSTVMSPWPRAASWSPAYPEHGTPQSRPRW